MFKYIGYDLKNDTLIATNSYTEWYLTLGNAPQISEYFSSLEEAYAWLKEHPTAHQDFLEEEERYYAAIIAEEPLQEPIITEELIALQQYLEDREGENNG